MPQTTGCLQACAVRGTEFSLIHFTTVCAVGAGQYEFHPRMFTLHHERIVVMTVSWKRLSSKGMLRDTGSSKAQLTFWEVLDGGGRVVL